MAWWVGERSGGGDRIYFARSLCHGESGQDVGREYFDCYYPRDAGMRRLMARPEGRLVHLPDLARQEAEKRIAALGARLRDRDSTEP